MPPTTPDATILYVRPSRPERTAIAEYATHFTRALELLPNTRVVDFLPSDLAEEVDSLETRRLIEQRVEELAQPFLEENSDSLIVHVEMGNALHREFWATLTLRRLFPKARFLATIHDPPKLCSNPYRYVETEFAGRTPLRLSDKALTRGAEARVEFLRKRAELRFVKACDGLLVLSEGGYKALRPRTTRHHVPLHKMKHITTVTSANRCIPEEDASSLSEIVTIFLGFICPERGIEELIQAFEILEARLKKEDAPIHPRLIIAGGASHGAELTSYLNGLRQRVKASLCPSDIRFNPGYVEDAERDRLISRADIQVLPFHTVPGSVFCSGSVIRAMAMGKAIITARTNTLGEEIVDGVTGLTYPEGDAGALAEQLLRLHTDVRLREKLALSALHHIDIEHTPQKVAKTVERIYRMPPMGGTA